MTESLFSVSLSPRLRAVLESIGKCGVLADIGTDHAFLPIEACKTGVCEKAIACDISPGPLKMASFNIHAAGLCGRIETRLGDGLKPLEPDEADCIAITGMGGMRILGIINEEPEKAKSARLILQPQHDLEELRRKLHSYGYEISEKLVREENRFYIIISAKYTANVTSWSDKEYFTGKQKGPDSILYLRQRLEKTLGYINSVSGEARKEAEKRLKWLENSLL